MDRRYAEMSFGGAKASDAGARRSEALVNRHLQYARLQNHRAQSYGGSTGSGAGFKGEPIQSVRAGDSQAQRQVFDEAGAGSARDTFEASRSWSRQGRQG